MRITKLRSNKGNMLAFIVGLAATFLIAFLVFSLAFVRFLGSHQQQNTAIEAAALAAAKDLSKLVVEDPNLGFISLSDLPPTGKNSKAGDNYYLPVSSINTVMANARLNMIIADLFQDDTMIQYAARDYTQAMQARQRLVTELQRCVQPGQTGQDIDGNAISPLQDAITAYQAIPINIESNTSLVPGSLTLTLGWESGLMTNMHIPQPQQYANMNANQQENGFYKAFTDVPYKGNDFVFAAVGDAVTLVDFRSFLNSTDTGALPWLIPTIVQCQADQKYRFNPGNGQTSNRTIHVEACAQPSCLIDNRPAPGEFLLSFPNGAVSGINTFYELLMNQQANRSPADVTQTPLAGDFAPNAMTPIPLPVLNNIRPPMGQTMRVALHDWIRRAGPGLNVQSLMDALNKTLSTDSGPHADVFRPSSGVVQVTSMSLSESNALPVSNKQWYSVSGLPVQANGTFDVYCRDFVFQPGRINGGIHAGEPLPESSMNGGNGGSVNSIALNPGSPERFPTGPAGGAVRPTYTAPSIAAEICLPAR